MKAIDLTHTLSATSPTWDNTVDFECRVIFDYKDSRPPDIFRKHEIRMKAGTGTHIDAPAHFVPGGRAVDKLTLKELATGCAVIRLDDVVNERYVVMPNVVEEFEKKHGTIMSGMFVIFHTGWSKYWETPLSYHNNHRFPSIHASTAELLLSRGIVGIGTDTLSADTGEVGFPVHRLILGADKYLVENIAHADLLPPTGAKILILPIKIQDASEAPLRMIALVD